MIQNSKTFAFSAENPTGVRAGGSQGGDCTKLRPTVTIPAGETVTLVDAAGPGVIQHMWFTGYVGHHFIIRMYWDDQEYPSVEAPLSAFFGCAYDENFVDRDGKYPVLNSAMMLVAPGRGYNSYFEMPFHKRARITMENRGDKDENLYYIITGAYQEILGDMHNLFGDTNAVHVSVNEKGYNIEQIIDGETVAEVLDYVQYNPKKLVRTLETWVTKSVKEGKISLEEGKEFLSNYRSGLYGYTYLE